MRWRLGRERTACSTCGAELDPDAVWCGGCGAPVAAPPDPTPDQRRTASPDTPDDEAEPDAAARTSWRRVLRVAVALAVVATAVVVLRPESAPRPVLGQVGALAGMSATGPPPGGLRLAWEAEIAADTAFVAVRGRGVVADGDVLRVGGLVVDLDTGRLVRRAAEASGSSRQRTEHVNGELVLVDTLTGRVEQRTPLPPAVADGDEPVTVHARTGDVTLVAVDGRSLLVRDDGSVVAELAGSPSPNDRGVDGAAAFPVAVEGGVVLVAAATGEVVDRFEVGEGQTIAVDAVADLAMVATTGGTLPGPTTGIPWAVELVDTRSGERLRSLVAQSAEPPRLLGTLDDGTVVFTTRSGREVAVRSIGPDGRFQPLAQVTTGMPVTDSPLAADSAALATAAVAGDRVVALDARRGVLAIAGGGGVFWQVTVDVPATIGAGDGFVAVVPEVSDESVRVLRVSDGGVAAQVSTSDAAPRTGTAPFAVLDGHVGLGPARPFGDPRVRLGDSTWLDLRTGRPTGVDDLFAPYAGEAPEAEVTAAWTVHGTATSAGRTVPIVSRSLPRSVVQLLEPGDGFTTFDLPSPDGDVVARAVGEPVGASATRLAVWRHGIEDRTEVATHVLDRATGEVTTVDGVVGAALVDDLLLAVEVDDAFTPTTLVGVNAATGRQLWSTADAGVVRATTPPRLDRDLLVVVGSLAVEARSLHDGGRAWVHASDVELSSHLVLGPERVVVAATDGEVVALDRRDGTIRWRTALGVPVTSMTGAGGDVLVGTTDGLVIHLDGVGQEVQRVAVGTDPVSGVAALGEAVVATVGDRVVALRPDGVGITREDQVDLP